MSAVPLSQKLIGLYLLERCRRPITREQFSVYMTENRFSDYMTVQQLIEECVQGGLMTLTGERPVFMQNTVAGRDAIALFAAQRLPLYLRRQADDFVTANAERIAREASVFTALIGTPARASYLARLELYDGVVRTLYVEAEMTTRERADSLAKGFAAHPQALADFLTALAGETPE